MSHVLPDDCWLPGVAVGPRYQHWVAADTAELAGDEQHYRSMCGVRCLRIVAGFGHEWESWPRCPTCARAVRLACRP